ncbi:thioredoxin [candidate division KSB1 bacterium]|nr:thioredoxin [candidate division KSB1 bacterium]
MSNETVASDVLHMTDAEFPNALKSHSMLVVDAYADWCGPCRMIAPIVKELATEYAGRVSFAKVDVDNNHGIARQFGIQSIPTMLFFKNGELVDRVVGAMPKAALKSRVDALVAAA